MSQDANDSKAARAQALQPQVKSVARSLLAWGKQHGGLLGLAGMLPALAWGQPTGGQVAAGTATISTPDANTTVINQATNKAVLNWNSFSIGRDGFVQFIQPSASAIALNRVVGSDPSSILGHLSANGQVFLVNPNGIFFGAGAVIDVAGIVATTMNIRDDDFLAGTYRFARVPGAADGSVINAGALNANGGYVVLAGDYVSNQGVVEAQAGTVLLASGNAMTLQFAGGSLINYAVDEATVAHLAGVENAGQILASGGRVVMTADVANELAATVVNNTGLVEAQSTVEKDGEIYLLGGGGDVANRGTLDASAQAGANGGHVEIRASGDIDQEAGSRVTVSGADTGKSDAGSVRTWADGTNRFKEGAAIEAHGGAQGGDGGFVELSGKGVQIAGNADMRAPQGKSGSILIDPLNVTITDQDSVNAGSTVGEQWIEGQLQSGADVTVLADGGAGASIQVEDLTDNALGGTNGSGTGGSLTLKASGAGSSITFADKNDTISVDRNLTLTADNGTPGSYAGTTIDVGNLTAGQGTPSGGGLNNNADWTATLDIDAGSVSTRNLTVGKSISTATDSAYTLDARAWSGNLTVSGDVSTVVVNDTKAGVTTNVQLKADAGNVTITGSVAANASGKGYYHYTWDTTADGCGGAAATSCYSTYADRSQPWNLVGQGDHPITTNLAITAGGSVSVTGTTSALAIDNSSDFAGNGGYWQTATDLSHVFWRPTAPLAAATVTAGGNASFGDTVSVQADGYATASYGETEYWSDMIAERALSTQGHTYYLQEWDPETNSYVWVPYSDSHSSVWTGGYTGNYVWNQTWYTLDNPDYGHTTPDYHYDSYSSFGATSMSYNSLTGPRASLDLAAGGSVALNGLDVRATNRSVSGGGSFSDSYWGRQDSNNVGASVSANQEVNYGDGFNTSFSVADASARVAISSGDDQSITVNGASNVVATHSAVTAAGNTQAAAGMILTAGSAAGGSGSALVSLNGPLNVEGADDADVTLTVRNYDGDITQAPSGAAITVTNHYTSGDARASFTADTGNVTLDDVAVTAGRAAYLSATADQDLQLTGTAAATASNRGQIDLTAGDALVIDATPGAVNATATGVGGVADVNIAGAGGVTANGAIGATATNSFGTASIDVQSSGGDIALNSSLTANANGNASVNAAATIGATTLAAGGSVAATSSGWGYNADIDLTGGSGLTVDGDVSANANTSSGSATVDLTTTGGATADIVQGAGSTVLANATTGAIRVNAGAASPNTTNATVLDLNGDLQARGTSGVATLAVAGQSGSVHDFSALSTFNAANVTLSTTGNGSADSGNLLLDGTGSAAGNIDSTTGATLTASTANGDLDTAAATLAVTNSSVGNAARAVAALTANGGSATLGAVSAGSAGSGSSTAMAYIDAAGADGLTVAGPLSATASGVLAKAQIDLDSSAGALTVNSVPAAVSATAMGVAGVADVNLAGAGGVTANGAIGATATIPLGTASIDVLSAGGDIVLNNSLTATADSNASVNAAATSGATTLAASGSVAATSSGLGYNADVDLTGGSGLTVGGGVSASAVNGAASITLASSTGNVALDHDLTALGASADVTATASTGTLAQAAGTTVRAGATSGGATVDLTSAGPMTIDGDVIAAATADGTVDGVHTGYARIDMLTTGGSTATITQAAASTIGAVGQATRLTVKAGAADLAASPASAAAFDLAGKLQAIDDVAGSTLTIAGASGTVHDFTVTAGSAPAQATITAYDADGALTLDGAGTVTGNDDSVSGASLTVTAAGSLDTSAATLAVSNTSIGTSAGARAQLDANGGSATLGATTVGTAGNGTAALIANGSTGLGTAADLAANAANGTASITLASSAGNVALDHNVTALGASADITATASTGTLAQGAGTTVRAGATNGSAEVDLTSAGPMTINGDVIAAATADGTVGGEHTGAAQVDLHTTGGSTATITQAAASTIGAVGRAARLTVNAGDADLEADTSRAAAFDLAGDLLAIDVPGGSFLEIAGASGSVNNFTVTAGSAPANATITTYDENAALTLTGNGTVTGDYDASTGASLTVTAAGSLDTSAATLAVSNTSIGSSAGAKAQLDANGGSATLGATTVGTAGNGTAVLIANGSTGLGTAADLAANAANGTASITLASSAGNVAFDHDLTAAGVNADVTATASSGTLAQAAGTTVRAGATSGSAEVDLTSAGPMTIDGDVIAAATADGTVDGAHTGSAGVNLLTTGGSTATITQAAASTIGAVGRAARLTVNAGDADLEADTSRAAAFDLAGDLLAIDVPGGSFLEIAGASGSVNNFTVTAGSAPANATITAYDENAALTLTGNGTVTGNYDASTGASLVVTAAGSLDTSAATLAVSNTSIGSSAGAKAQLDANGGSATLGATTVGTTGNGTAALISNGSAGLGTAADLAANAANGTASITLASSAGNVALDHDLTAAGVNAEISATASTGTLAQAAGTTVRAGATSGSAEVDLTSAGPMTINGDVIAAATADGTVGGEHTGAAQVDLHTTGGSTATITQAAASTIAGAGTSSTVSVSAGAADLAASPASAAAFDLAGSVQAIDTSAGSTLTIAGASGTVHDFTVTAGSAPAQATITAYDADGALTLDGVGTVTGNDDSATGASLTVTAAGSLDAAAATLAVSNTNTNSSAGAQATLDANGGSATLGATTVGTAGNGTAALIANGSTGLGTAADLAANAANGTASITLASSAGNVALDHNVTALGASADVTATASTGTLAQAAGTTVRAGATSGSAEVDLTSAGPMTINGDVIAAATADGTVGGEHTGYARTNLLTTGGSTATITQAAASTIGAVGRATRLTVTAGDSDLEADTSRAAAFNLAGNLLAVDMIGGSTLEIAGASGSVNDFTVTAGHAFARASITTYDENAALTLRGSGTVTGNYDGSTGASLALDAAGNLDTTAATLSVSNGATGEDGGAQALLVSGGAATLGDLAVATAGGGVATLDVSAADAITATGDLLASASNGGLGGGSSDLSLHTRAGDGGGNIVQNAGTLIRAQASGTAAGSATVDIQAGACCTSNVDLNGEVEAEVSGGTGDATVKARGMTVSVSNVSADVVAGGSGDSLIEMAAPTELRVRGVLDSQAASPAATAGITLVSDRLTYTGGNAVLSRNNGRVQLAPFSTNYVIGVNSNPDFDATPSIDYNKATLQKFVGNGAELRFGGEFDRSTWFDGADPCIANMALWSDTLQQTADIHVAGRDALSLRDTAMVFDTDGITYYHDNAMSPWSVPDGHVAIYVPRPAVSIDRYLDRTDNTLHQVVQGSTDAFGAQATSVSPPPTGTVQLADGMYLAGDGLNLGGADISGGVSAPAADGTGGTGGTGAPAGGIDGTGVGSPGADAPATPSGADGDQPAATPDDGTGADGDTGGGQQDEDDDQRNRARRAPTQRG